MKKIIIIGIIFLFVGMGFQPAFAVENRVSNDNIEKVEDCDCQTKDRLNPIVVMHLMTRLQVVTNSLLSRFGHIPEVKEKCQEVLDEINSFNPLSRLPLICLPLLNIALGSYLIFEHLDEIMKELYENGSIICLVIRLFLAYPYVALVFIYYIIGDIGKLLGCWNEPPEPLAPPYEIKQIISI